MIENIDEIIEALGGTVATGKICGLNPPAVSMWKTRAGIPAEHYFTICDALEAVGKPLPAKRLFGFPEKSTASAE